MPSQSLPSLVIFINNDITYPPPPNDFIGESPIDPQLPSSNVNAMLSEQTNLQVQLFIDDTISKAEFDARVAGNPDYTTIIHLQGMRVLVILDTFQDLVNREQADIVIFLYQGQADVEFNRYGPPRKSINLQRITIYDLLHAKHEGECCLPLGFGGGGCNSCHYPFYCDRDHTFSGIKICNSCKCGCGLIDNQGVQYSSIYLPNCDNEIHNKDFINRS